VKKGKKVNATPCRPPQTVTYDLNVS